jgi:hypothetical protein
MRKKELRKIIENHSQDNLALRKSNLQLNKEIEQIKKNPPKYKTGDRFGSEIVVSSDFNYFKDGSCEISFLLQIYDDINKNKAFNVEKIYIGDRKRCWIYTLENEDERAIQKTRMRTEQQLDEYVKSHNGKKESTAENPTGLLRKQLREDKEQRECWIANIACSITDAEIDYKKKTGKKNLNSADRQLVYNKGAELFINLLCKD